MDGFDEAFYPVPPMKMAMNALATGSILGVAAFTVWILLCYEMLALAHDCGAAIVWCCLASAALSWLVLHWTYETLFRKMRKHGLMKFDWSAGYRSYIHGLTPDEEST